MEAGGEQDDRFGLDARSAGSGGRGRCGGRGPRGLRDRKGRDRGRTRPKPARDRKKRPASRRAGGYRRGLPDLGRLAAVGVYPLRDPGALPDVRRGHRQRPYSARGLRSFGSEKRLLRLADRPLFPPLQPPPRNGSRGFGGRMHRTAQGLLCPAPALPPQKAELAPGEGRFAPDRRSVWNRTLSAPSPTRKPTSAPPAGSFFCSVRRSVTAADGQRRRPQGSLQRRRSGRRERRSGFSGSRRRKSRPKRCRRSSRCCRA